MGLGTGGAGAWRLAALGHPPRVCSSVKRHLRCPRPVALSNAALDMLASVANGQAKARSGMELIRSSAGDSAIAQRRVEA